MNVEEIRKKVRSLCEDAGLQFFFAVPNASEVWSGQLLIVNSFLRKIVSYHKELETLPPVTPTQNWIPVSERLPKDRDWYLGIFKEPDTDWINPIPFICDYVGRKTKATTKEYWILHGFTDMDEHIDYYFNLECVAWMPLPQAYREVEE